MKPAVNLLAAVAGLLAVATLPIHAQQKDAKARVPLRIQEQGSFAAGGSGCPPL
jgi:hypothetical protein